MMLETGFVTHSEYQKHIRGEWRTVHDLWRHIRNYMTTYAQPGGFTQGSIAYADADGFLTENNAQLYWDAAQHFLGVGVGAPVCRTHIRIAECADYRGLNPDTILLLENDDNVVLQFQCATNGEARIVFADDDFNPPAGRILYDFSDDEMDFTMGKNVLLVLGPDGADSRIISSHRGIKIDSPSYAAFIADSHNADAYVEFQEDGALKWTMGFDYDDGQKFQISQGLPGTNVRFEIDAGTLINLYLDVGIRNSQDLRFYDNGNYVGFKPPALAADQIWVLPAVDGDAGWALVTDGGGNLSFSAAGTGDVTAGAVITDHAIVRGDGGAKGVQDSGVIIDDTDNVTGMVTLTLPNEGLHILDTNASHDLIIKAGSDLIADRIFTIVTGDVARTITFSGDPTLGDWFDQAVKEASAVTFDDITVSNPVNIYALSHDAFADYAVTQHRVWEDSIAQDIHADNISEGSVTQHVGAIDHNALLNYAANRHFLLGATDSTAYRGDRGTLAYNHISASGSSHSYLNQAVLTSSKPQFAGVNLGGAVYYLGDGAAASKLYTLNINEIYADTGTASDPSYTFSANDDTGMYYFVTGIGFSIDDVMRLSIKNNYLEVKPSTDSYGIIIRDSGSSDYLNLLNINGVSYLRDNTTTFLSGSGSYAYAADHGTAATDQLVNVCYGTGSPPAANTTTIGALFINYTA